MQATRKTRWFDLGPLKQAVLVIGVIAALAVGTLTIGSFRDGAPADSDRAAATAANSSTYLDYRERSMFLPSVSSAAGSSTFLDYRERNEAAPASSDAATRGDFLDYRERILER